MSFRIDRLFLKTVRSRGVALVITLGTLVLVTVLILAFFSRAQLNRQVSFSSTNLLKADMLGRSALDIIVGELRNEIANNGSSSNGGNASYPNTYFPNAATPAQALPVKAGVSSATGLLVKVSGENIPIRFNGTIQGSGISISTSSRNSRLVTASRWFTSTAGSPQLGSQNTLPTWLFVTRGNDVQTPASVNTAKDPSSNDYVIGRFAYTVYDLGGLLDVNVAGYPALVSSTDVGYKSSPAYTDLSLVGVSSAADFVAWRNAATGTNAASFKEWATGTPSTSGTLNAAGLAAARSGHIEAALGDNAVLSRHDLLKSTWFSGTTPRLLTHFSRSLNAASAIPSSLSINNPNLADVRAAVSGTITHYRDDGTTETYTISAGDPLLQRRFSLAKLAWIGHDGPNASAFSSALSDTDRKTAILACFGLTLISDGTNSRWSYQPSGTPGTIGSLASMATLGREPNFFELLKAGIVEGSIGKSSSTTLVAGEAVPNNMAYDDQPVRESNKDLQILQIGANAINCVKSDNYPVTLLYSGSNGSLTVPVYGNADLPRLVNVMNTTLYANAYVDGSNDKMLSCSALVLPELFNPHRSGTSAYNGPSKIRIRIANGTLDKLYVTVQGMSGSLYRNFSPGNDLTALSPIEIPSSSFESYRTGIKPVYGSEATSATTLSSQLGNNVVTGTSGNFHGFNFYTYSGLPVNYPKGSGSVLRAKISNVLFVLDYWNAATSQWRVYDTLVGNELASATGISKPSLSSGNVDFTPALPVLSASVTGTSRTIIDAYCWGITKIDPRTSRFGVSAGNYYGPGKNQALNQCGIFGWLPFGGTGSSHSLASYIYPGLWIQGKKRDWVDSDGSQISNVADPDGTVRPADGWLDQSASATTNLYANVSDTAAACRPILLHRPFQNVAELGYVFRDSPWKSLNFFDETSGDGALLDLFTIADEPSVVAGKSSLNTSEALVQQALLTGVAQNEDGTGPLANPSGIAAAYNGSSGYAIASGSATSTMPVNLAGLTAFMSSSNLNSVYSTSATPLKSMRESVVRALAGSTQTRTWNLLIDVVAQTGRYPSSVHGIASLDNFIVEGESRYWLSIAIDRYTGKIVGRQLEPVHE